MNEIKYLASPAKAPWQLGFDVLQEEKDGKAAECTDENHSAVSRTEHTSKAASTSAVFFAPPCPLWILQIPGKRNRLARRLFPATSRTHLKAIRYNMDNMDNLFDVFLIESW